MSIALAFVLRAGAQSPSPNPRVALLNSWTAQFSAAYDAADKCERTNQTKDAYFTSIHDFFFGMVIPGWFDRKDTLLKKFDGTSIRADLETRLNVLGKKVAAEWAKSNSCRKIRTSPRWNPLEVGKPSVEEWYNQLLAAANRDTGDGKALGKAIDDVSKQVDETLK